MDVCFDGENIYMQRIIIYVLHTKLLSIQCTKLLLNNFNLYWPNNLASLRS